MSIPSSASLRYLSEVLQRFLQEDDVAGGFGEREANSRDVLWVCLVLLNEQLDFLECVAQDEGA